ncbi:MAG: alpha/beta hydrolase [Capsulimonadales bacterium]|nr:alpha/beta hydrolase [Capsulimonadales bacterium]
MAMWQSGYVEVNGLKWHYRRTGANSGKPALVMAHGFSDDGACWTTLAEELEAEFDVVLPDARGHGKSDAPEEGYGLLDLANDLAAVLTALELRKPALLGHSMGGATSFVLAGTRPELPGAILIEDAGALNLGSTQPTEEQNRRWEGMRRWVEGVKRQTREELIAVQKRQTPHWSDEEVGLWADSKHRLSLRVLNRADAAPVNWSALLPNIACPALLITADPALGAMVTDEGADDLKRLVPHLERAHIPGAGHCIRRDRPEEFLDVVRGFLKKTVRPE